MRKLIPLILILFFVQTAYAVPTKSVSQVLEWTLIDSDDVQTTETITVTGNYAHILHIDCCLASTDAHEGTEIIVQISSEADVNDSWTNWRRFVGPTGTATKSDCNDASSGTTVYVTNPATGNLDHDGKFIFIYDTATIANSTIAYQVDNSGDAGDTITLLEAPNTTDTDCDIYTIDGNMEDGANSAVGTYAVELPISASYARVIFNNFYDTDGTNANVCVRVRLSKVTGL